jgi:hypothetical protein
MEITKVQFGVGNEILVGSIVRDNPFSKPRLLLIHGAGQATRERARPLALKLAEHHICLDILVFPCARYLAHLLRYEKGVF